MSFVTHPSQFQPPPPRRVARIEEIPGLNGQDGKPAKLFGRKLRRPEYKAYQRSTMDDNGVRTLATWIDNAEKYIAQVICDKDGNPIWQTGADAVAFLDQYDQEITDALFAAALKANSPDPEAVARAEKNSGETPSSSENGTSPSTSGALIPVS